MSTVFIARHGETDYNKQGLMQGRGIDRPLNQTGRLQARALADYLKDKSLDYIYSSSLMRAMETAEIIAWTLRMQYEAYPELDEMSFGYLEGRPIKEVKNKLVRLNRSWQGGDVEEAIREGESPAQVLKRASSRISGILKEHQDSTILFILHGRLIRILLSEWMGYGLSQMHRIEHCNGALYQFECKNNTFHPVFLNKMV